METNCGVGEPSGEVVRRALLFGSPVFSCPRRVLEPDPVHRREELAAYDRMVQRWAWILNRPFVNRLARIGKKNARVLDIGTGPGWIPIELARRKPGWELWAVDPSAESLEQARAHAERAGVASRIHFVPGATPNLPFEASSFDLVYSHFTLHHLERPAEMVAEAARLVLKGGQVLIKDLLRQPEWKARLLLAFSRYALGYSPLQLQMYRESLRAALRLEEIRALVQAGPLGAHAQVRIWRGLDFIVHAPKIA